MLTDDEALRAIRQVAGELNEIGAAWREQIARLQRDAGDAFRRAITPALGIADAVRQAVEKMQADVTLVGQQFQDAVRRGVDPQVREGLRQLLEALEQAHVYYGDIVVALGERGWYVDMDRMTHPDVREALDLFEAGEAERAHESLCRWFEEQMDDVAASIAKSSPARGRHVSQAIAAHRRSEYALSVPVFLLEADGICQEFVGVQAYKKKGDGQRAIGAAIEARAAGDDMLLAMCAALRSVNQPLVFGPHERARHGMADAVNRHTVLHGENVDYDERRNSCQAFSFLAHVASVLPVVARNAPP